MLVAFEAPLLRAALRPLGDGAPARKHDATESVSANRILADFIFFDERQPPKLCLMDVVETG